jgi:hypothetical protein
MNVQRGDAVLVDYPHADVSELDSPTEATQP